MGYAFSCPKQFNQIGEEQSNDFMYISVLPLLGMERTFSFTTNQVREWVGRWHIINQLIMYVYFTCFCPPIADVLQWNHI